MLHLLVHVVYCDKPHGLRVAVSRKGVAHGVPGMGLKSLLHVTPATNIMPMMYVAIQ